MEKTLIVVIFIAIFSSCINSEKLSGHWHLKRQNFNKTYISLDVTKDTIAYLNVNSFNDTETIRHYSKERSLISGECGGDFEYEVDEKKVHLKNTQNFGDYYGEKFELTNSHKLEDYMNTLLVDIVFPKIENRNKVNPVHLKEDLLFKSIIIGKTKDSIENQYKIQVYDKFLELKGIEKWIESIQKHTSKAELDFIKFRIVSDENAPIKLIKSVTEKLRKKGFKKIYLTCLQQNQKKNYLFEYLELKEINLNEEGEIKKLIE
jgi:hypothetical protein